MTCSDEQVVYLFLIDIDFVVYQVLAEGSAAVAPFVQ